jgi:tellurite resistance protein TerC
VVQRALHFTWRTARRTGVAVVGGLVLVGGVVMIVLPGPAVVAIPAGLGILALEFEFAQRWLESVREYWRKLTDQKGK